MSINRWMDKEVVIHNVHNGLLLSHKRNAFESVLMRWINQESFIQSEENQKEKYKYRILTHIYTDSEKMYWWIYFQGSKGETDREQTYGHGRRGREGKMYVESNMESYITICKINSQQEFAVCLRKLKQGLCINLEGWDGEGDRRGFKREGIYV